MTEWRVSWPSGDPSASLRAGAGTPSFVAEFLYGLGSSALGLILLLFRDPGVDVLLEDVERNGAVAENDVVILLQVELRAEFASGAGAEVADLHLSDLVAERLAGPSDVAVDLVDDVELGLG